MASARGTRRLIGVECLARPTDIRESEESDALVDEALAACRNHDGAIDARARLAEMDLMGIDQVLVIPTMVIMHVPFATNAEWVTGIFSARNRSTPMKGTSSGRSTLSATARPVLESVARYTMPVRPTPTIPSIL